MPMRLALRPYSTRICLERPDDIFVFGDNFQRQGRGPKSGQAIIRDMRNSVGLAVKHAPRLDAGAYLRDADRDLFLEEVKRVHEIIAPHLRRGGTVWWPADGIGTGRAELARRAPDLHARLAHWSRGLFEKTGDMTYTSCIICGGTNYNDRGAAWPALDDTLGRSLSQGSRLEILHSGGKGTGALAQGWAIDRDAVTTILRPDYRQHGDAARERANLLLAAKLAARRDQAGAAAHVVAMPGGENTEHMLEIARQNAFDITRIAEQSPEPAA